MSFETPRAEQPTIRTWQDAEECAAAWTRAMGHPDAVVTRAGADEGIDVAGSKVLVQVKFRVVKASRPEVQQLVGAAGRRDVDLFFFSFAGYTAEALAWAISAGVAAFQLSLDGSVSALNEPAVLALRVAPRAPGWTASPTRGDSYRGSAPVQGLRESGPGFWRRIGAWFGRLFRTVAWEAGSRTDERRTAGLMTGAQLMTAGVGIAVFGLIGAVAMITSAFDPSTRAEDGVAGAIGGVVFYALVAAFGLWARALGSKRHRRLSTSDTP